MISNPVKIQDYTKIYTCEIEDTTVPCRDRELLRANILFTNPANGCRGAYLISDAVNDCGKIRMYAEKPLRQICLSRYLITVGEEACCQGRRWDLDKEGANDAFSAVGMYPEMRASYDHIYAYEIVPAPKPKAVHAGWIETSTGRREIRRYPDGKTLQIFDPRNGACCDVLAVDLATYIGS